MPEAPASILKKHNLRVTDCRIDVIKHFMERKGALCQSDLESEFKQYDRVTIYRTLNSFLKSGILHKIPNESGTIAYGWSHYTHNSGHHFDNHIHFQCNNCGRIECLEGTKVPEVSVPKGYRMEKVNLIVDGICVNCV